MTSINREKTLLFTPLVPLSLITLRVRSNVDKVGAERRLVLLLFPKEPSNGHPPTRFELATFTEPKSDNALTN